MQGTNQMLLDFHNQKEQIKKTLPFLYHINRTKIQEWENNNRVRLMAMDDKINKLKEECFEMEGEGEEKKIKFTEPTTTPAKEAVYKTEIVSPKTLFKAAVTKQVLVSAAVPEMPQPADPIFKEGKTKEAYHKAFDEIMGAEVEIK